MTYTCPKNAAHQSDDPEYCSVCGAKMAGAASGLSAPSAPAAQTVVPAQAPLGTGTPQTCPDCGTPRHPGARFCEICRYNYDTLSPGGVAAVTTVPPAPPTVPAPVVESVPPPAVAVVPPISTARWEAVVSVDASLYTDPDPAIPCPTSEPERLFPLDLAESLIGRRSDRQDIHPEIPLTDPGVSHRHAKLYRQADGSLLILDVGSTNGTQVNGVELTSGVKQPLQNGDQITIGCWTRIKIVLL